MSPSVAVGFSSGTAGVIGSSGLLGTSIISLFSGSCTLESGFSGFVGVVGVVGFVGLLGVLGVLGSWGLSGVVGSSGSTGVTGSAGFSPTITIKLVV